MTKVAFKFEDGKTDYVLVPENRAEWVAKELEKNGKTIINGKVEK